MRKFTPKATDKEWTKAEVMTQEIEEKIADKYINCPLIPRPNLIVIEVIQVEVEQKTSSGIITAIEPTSEIQGLVLAVGNDVKYLEPGQIIKYQGFAGDMVKHNGKNYLVMHADKVLAVIR